MATATKPAGIKARLAAFVAANPRCGGLPCPACQLPADVAAAVREEKARGARVSVLAAFLRKDGYKVSDYMLRHHFREHEQR